MSKPITLTIEAGQTVPGLLLTPPNTSACFIFAHGAGAGMAHMFMAAVATGLSARGIATLRYQFPYMERGSRRPAARLEGLRGFVELAAEAARTKSVFLLAWASDLHAPTRALECEARSG